MNALINYGLIQLSVLEAQTEIKLEELRERYRKSKDLPRKQKKKVRKHLNSTYSILMWSKQYLKTL